MLPSIIKRTHIVKHACGDFDLTSTMVATTMQTNLSAASLSQCQTSITLADINKDLGNLSAAYYSQDLPSCGTFWSAPWPFTWWRYKPGSLRTDVPEKGAPGLLLMFVVPLLDWMYIYSSLALGTEPLFSLELVWHSWLHYGTAACRSVADCLHNMERCIVTAACRSRFSEV
jgi:hypothetical protein